MSAPDEEKTSVLLKLRWIDAEGTTKLIAQDWEEGVLRREDEPTDVPYAQINAAQMRSVIGDLMAVAAHQECDLVIDQEVAAMYLSQLKREG